MNIDWSNAPAHATHWCPGNAKIEAGWIHYLGGQRGEFYSCYENKGLEHIPDFPEWRKSRLIPRPSETIWTGEGLPPVGTVCEIAASTPHLTIRHPEGTEVKIYANFTDDRGIELAAFVDGVGQVAGVATAKCFRPILTPDQIAAEERKRITDDIQRVCTNGENNGVPYHEALYDAGYRKFEIVDGEA
ncbi:hypothetical protein ACRZ5O_22710 [Pseudomonas protegens]|uniref:hypothetical protein n=1 Tax=Pseudomonas protegens TaxID=380021 RepID=UPI003FD7BC3A